MTENENKVLVDGISFERSLELMKYYQDEFKYRHAHYWSVLVKMFILDLVVTILPITTEIMGISLGDGVNKYALIFPIMGISIAILTKSILEDEAKKMRYVNKAKYEINKTLPEMYQYRDYVADKSDPKLQLASHLRQYIFWLEIVVCIVVVLMLYGEYAVQLVRNLICGSC